MKSSTLKVVSGNWCEKKPDKDSLLSEGQSTQKLESFPTVTKSSVDNCASAVPTAEFYDPDAGIRHDQIVGWVIFYSDDSHFLSLDGHQGDQLADHDVQVLLVYYLRPDGKRGPDGERLLYRAVYTRNTYWVPFAKRIKFGDWTDIQNHNRIFACATKVWWPKCCCKGHD